MRVTQVRLFILLLAMACGDGGRAADSARAAQREDSIRRLGAAAWSDAQLIAYLRVVSSTLIADEPLVRRRASSAGVKVFGNTVASDHRRIMRLVDSLEARRNPVTPPLVSSEVLRQHEAEMRRLAGGGAFDRAYMRSTQLLLREVSLQLDKADATRYTAAVAQLLNRARTALRVEIRSADALETKLR